MLGLVKALRWKLGILGVATLFNEPPVLGWRVEAQDGPSGGGLGGLLLSPGVGESTDTFLLEGLGWSPGRRQRSYQSSDRTEKEEQNPAFLVLSRTK